jgi:2,4-dienoyl-CoA reductase-like NADH-dependent reductase (Old Yellow Enzyme family)
MSEQLGDQRNRPTAQLEELYRIWGAGGAGLLITGNVMIDRRHVGEPRNVVVEDERDLDGLRRWARAGQAHGAQMWVQINHPGRQALRIAGAHPVGPSAIAPKVPGAVKPHALTSEQIETIIARFVTTASIVKAAGFDGVQLHAAHGYLLSQFLSPAANVREDEWGGDEYRRQRLLLEVVTRVRAAVGDAYPLAVKLNSADFQRGGTTEAQSAQVVVALAQAGVDLVEISGGTYEAPAMVAGRESTREREAYFLRYAEEVRARVPDLALMVTGGFRSRTAMVAALAGGACDVIGLGRPLAVEPMAAAQLLKGSRERLAERRERVGAKQLDAAIDLYWHTRQLQRIGAGQVPDQGAGALRTGVAMLATNGWGALRRKRGG